MPDGPLVSPTRREKEPPKTLWAKDEKPLDPWDTAKQRKDKTHLTTVMTAAASQPRRPLSPKIRSPLNPFPKGCTKAPLSVHLTRPKVVKCGLDDCHKTIDPRVSITGSKGKGSRRKGVRIVFPHGAPSPQVVAGVALRRVPKNRQPCQTTQTNGMDRVRYTATANKLPDDLAYHRLVRKLSLGNAITPSPTLAT